MRRTRFSCSGPAGHSNTMPQSLVRRITQMGNKCGQAGSTASLSLQSPRGAIAPCAQAADGENKSAAEAGGALHYLGVRYDWPPPSR